MDGNKAKGESQNGGNKKTKLGGKKYSFFQKIWRGTTTNQWQPSSHFIPFP